MILNKFDENGVKNVELLVIIMAVSQFRALYRKLQNILIIIPRPSHKAHLHIRIYILYMILLNSRFHMLMALMTVNIALEMEEKL